jgi:hypothetical protein
MAQASGADLQRALEEGRITHGDWADVVTRCRGCGWTEGCDCWMAAQDGAGDATVPQACPNASFFEAVLSGTDQSPTTPSHRPDAPPEIVFGRLVHLDLTRSPGASRSNPSSMNRLPSISGASAQVRQVAASSSTASTRTCMR